MNNGPSHFGLLPGTDEGSERVLNAIATYFSSLGYGALRTTPVDGAGASLAPGSVQYAAIAASTSGNNTLVSAVSGKKIRVLSLFLVSAGTVTTRFESAADGTALTGQMALVANTGYVLGYNPNGWFETVASQLLNLELSAAISVAGSLTYIEV